MKVKRLKIPVEIKGFINYEQTTGVFLVKKRRALRDKIGANPVNVCSKTGYGRIMFKGKLYLAHRVAWYFVYNKQPGYMLDHIDGNILNNKASNLREVNYSESNFNRKPKHNKTAKKIGVYFSSNHGKWIAYISIDGKQKYLGIYKTEQEATKNRLRAEKLSAKLHRG